MAIKLVLTNRAAETLRDALATIGWANDIPSIYRGGQILAEVLPELKERPKMVDPRNPTEADAKAVLKWADTKVPAFELSDKQMETAKKAITFFAEKAVLQSGKYTNELLKALGMGE